MTISSSAGETKNAVEAAPPQKYSPGVPIVCATTGSSNTPKPSPNPCPARFVSPPKSANAARS